MYFFATTARCKGIQENLTKLNADLTEAQAQSDFTRLQNLTEQRHNLQLELMDINFVKLIYLKYKKKINKKNYKIATYQIIRDSIDLMIRDLLSNTQKNLKDLKIKSPKDIFKTDKLIVSFSHKLQNSEKEIRSFLRSKMYNNNSVLRKNQRGKLIIKKLFEIIKSKPRKFLTKDQLTKDKYRAISDFISGMTDRYAINLYNNYK